MDNKTHAYSYLDSAIATGEWHSAALTELDNLINDIENGRKRFNRYHNSLLRLQPNGLRRSGRANAIFFSSIIFTLTKICIFVANIRIV